jgi:putative Holliday junction resolvase
MILGIDWGKKKIGLAIAHEEVAIASALKTLENTQQVFSTLRSIVHEYDISHIVIGRSAHRSQNDNMDAIEKFGTACQDHLGVDVVYVDEMFSTREAQMNMISAGKRNVSATDDAEAARIILQNYIDARNEKI